MGLFDFFKKKNAASTPTNVAVSASTPSPLLDLVEVAPSVSLPRAFVQDWPLIQKTRLSCISITATPTEELALEQSKFGYYPILPLDFDYPIDELGKPMFPLAQINFSELPPMSGFPSSGYLQCYISVFDDLSGLDFNNPQSQKNFRVLYFEEKDLERYKADFSFLDEVMSSDMLPVYKPHSLSFATKDEYMGFGDVRYEENKEFNLVDRMEERYPAMDHQLEDLAYETFPTNGHKIGGYAFFTQEDPRIGNDKFKDYILLLQIDTDEAIMWGDSGVANFFIHPADLAKKDFSKVMYNWDCY